MRRRLSAGALRNPGARALRDLRRARRRRAYGDLDWADALYKVYVTAIFGAIGVSVASGYVGGDPVTPAELASATERGPAFLGLVVAVAVAAGLRSGGRGGPLALQPADVQLVLLAPLPRGVVLRRPAADHLRFGAAAGGVAGMVGRQPSRPAVTGLLRFLGLLGRAGRAGDRAGVDRLGPAGVGRPPRPAVGGRARRRRPGVGRRRPGRRHGHVAQHSARPAGAVGGGRRACDDPPGGFSRGMRQKASIALALVRPFGVLLADEPYDGLDPPSREALDGLVVEAAAAGAAVVLATHRIEVLERADRCLAIEDGQLVYDGPADGARFASG